MADVHVKGPNNTLRLFEDQGDGTHAEVISVIGGVGGGGGGTPLARMYRPTSYTPVPTGQTAAVSARIAIPADVWTANSIAEVHYIAGKVTGGAVDTPSSSIYVGATAFTPSGATNRMAGVFTLGAGANSQIAVTSRIFGNHTDLTTVICTQQLNTPTPTSASITSAGRITSSTLNLANAWDICITLTTSSNDTAAVSDAYVLIYDPTGTADGGGGSDLLVMEEGSTQTATATSINFVGDNVTASHSGTDVTVTITGDSDILAVQTYTPNVSNAVPNVIDRSLGRNWKLVGPVDDIQEVNLPTNMDDGQEMRIDLHGGAGSGAWTPVWSSGAPSTPGWKFMVSGVAPTAPASGFFVPLYIERIGNQYRVTAGPSEVAE